MNAKIFYYQIGNGIAQCRYQFDSKIFFTIELVTALPNAVTKMIGFNIDNNKVIEVLKEWPIAALSFLGLQFM